MKKELQQRIYDRWPKWFNPKGPIQHTLIPFGLAVDDGWFQLIWDLCESIEKILGDAPFEVLQVKEKFAGLRFYTEGGGEVFQAIYSLITEAERKSYVTCEICGQPGEVRGGRWLKTLCDEHSAGKAAEDLSDVLQRPENQEALETAAQVIKNENDRLLQDMQESGSREAMDKAFHATPEDLGKTAVEGAKKDDPQA